MNANDNNGVQAPTPEKPLHPLWPLPIIVLALIAGVLGFFVAPEIDPAKGPPPWFSTFFPSAAGTIAALFIALALGTIHTSAGVRAAILTVSYVAVGEIAALTGTSTELPAASYKFVLAATIGAGIGALGSALVLGAHAIADKAWQQRLRVLTEIAERKFPG